MIIYSDILLGNLLSHFCDSCRVVADVHGNLSERSEHGLLVVKVNIANIRQEDISQLQGLLSAIGF